MTSTEILVATDLSPASRSAYPYAISMARGMGARVTLLHIDEFVDFGFHNARELDEYLSTVVRQTAKALEDHRESIAASGVAATSLTGEGPPWREILKVARDRAPAMVVVTKQGARGMARLLLGSTTKRVLRHIELPIMVVPAEEAAPDPAHRFERIVAATDFSIDSERGLKATLTLAEALDVRVDLTHVLRLPTFLPIVPGEVPAVLPRGYEAAWRQNAAERLDEAVSGANSTRLSGELRIAAGVAKALAEEASKPGDLLVIPSHGKGAVAATLLGSVAERALKLATRPVVILPRPYLATRYAT